MADIEEQLTDQFYEWERRGRGWQVWDASVSIEPPFQPFYGHYRVHNRTLDDGSRPTFLSSLVDKVRQNLAKESASEFIEEKEELEPDLLERNSLVEMHASLPPGAQISKEVFEQFILSLANCHEPITFELIGKHDSITAQLVMAESDVDSVRNQLEAHFPEVICVEQSAFLKEAWSEATDEETLILEFGLSHEFMISLTAARNFSLDPFIGLVAALSHPVEHELALFQVIFQPVRHPWDESILRSVTDGSGKGFFVNRPELADEAKRKIARPLFAVVVRIAVKSNGRLIDIAKEIAGALTVYSAPGSNELIPLENSNYPFHAHEEDLLRRQSRRCGMILNSDELVSLVHLPSSSVRSPKLKREVLKTKSVPKIALNSGGLFFGINTYAGVTNEVRLNVEQRVRHTHIIGASGTGKSTLLYSLIKQDLDNGQGLAVFDPHGDLIDKVLGTIPEHRINDVVLLDPSDPDFSVGFNILSAHTELEKNLLASDLVSVFQRLSTSWGDQMGSVLNNAILAFLESTRGGTLADLQRFLIEPAFRNEFLKTVREAQVLYYWKKSFPMLTGNKSIGPVLSRLSGFLDRKPVRYMVTQRENRLDFGEIMNSGKIFLAKLAQGQIGNENAYLLGSFLVSKFQQLAMSRQAQIASTRRDFWCYCDEFHNFITPSMAQILNGARKYRLGLVLAHHELRQLQRESEVASAVLSHPCTRVCFRVGDDDAKKLGDGFSFFDGKDIQNLPDFHAIARVERPDCDFNLTLPYPEQPDQERAATVRNRVITASREKYSVSRKQIEAEEIAALSEFDEPPTKQSKPAVTKSAAVLPVPSPVVNKPTVPESQPSETPNAEKAPTVNQPVVNEPQSPSTSETKPEETTANANSDEKNSRHQSIKEQIEKEAESLDYTVTLEEFMPDGRRRADVVLRRGEKCVACEISVTNTVEYELANIAKCLNANFPHVASICRDKRKLAKIQEAFSKTAAKDDLGKVAFYSPEDFIARLFEWASGDPQGGIIEKGKPKKLDIPLSTASMTQEQREQKEREWLDAIKKRMKGNEGK